MTMTVVIVVVLVHHSLDYDAKGNFFDASFEPYGNMLATWVYRGEVEGGDGGGGGASAGGGEGGVNFAREGGVKMRTPAAPDHGERMIYYTHTHNCMGSKQLSTMCLCVRPGGRGKVHMHLFLAGIY